MAIFGVAARESSLIHWATSEAAFRYRETTVPSPCISSVTPRRRPTLRPVTFLVLRVPLSRLWVQCTHRATLRLVYVYLFMGHYPQDSFAWPMAGKGTQSPFIYAEHK